MTDLATLDRALATLRAWPDLAGGLEELSDALLVIEVAAAASPAADGGRLHLRLMDRLCAWIRRISPAASARRFPMLRAENLVRLGPHRGDPDLTALLRAFHRARHFGRFHMDDTNLGNWLDALPEPAPGVQLALDVLRRRGPAQLAVERVFQPWQRHPEVWVGGPGDEGEWRPDPDPELAAWSPDLTDANLQRCDLSGIPLRQAEFYNTHMQGANLTGADLTAAKLLGTRLDGARLDRACLVGADLRMATLEGCWLNGADLRGANLSGASLVCARLFGADLSGTKLDAVLTDASFDDETRADVAQLQALRANDGLTGDEDMDLGPIFPRPLPPLFGAAELEQAWQQGATFHFRICDDDGGEDRDEAR